MVTWVSQCLEVKDAMTASEISYTGILIDHKLSFNTRSGRVSIFLSTFLPTISLVTVGEKASMRESGVIIYALVMCYPQDHSSGNRSHLVVGLITIAFGQSGERERNMDQDGQAGAPSNDVEKGPRRSQSKHVNRSSSQSALQLPRGTAYIQLASASLKIVSSFSVCKDLSGDYVQIRCSAPCFEL